MNKQFPSVYAVNNVLTYKLFNYTLTFKFNFISIATGGIVNNYSYFTSCFQGINCKQGATMSFTVLFKTPLRAIV